MDRTSQQQQQKKLIFKLLKIKITVKLRHRD